MFGKLVFLFYVYATMALFLCYPTLAHLPAPPKFTGPEDSGLLNPGLFAKFALTLKRVTFPHDLTPKRYGNFVSGAK